MYTFGWSCHGDNLLAIELVPVIATSHVSSINLMDVPVVLNELSIEGSKRGRVKKPYYTSIKIVF